VTDSLAPERVLPLLTGRLGSVYRYSETTPSTQRMLGPGDLEGTVAVADEQTEGRGRFGRSWQAPAGTALLFSTLLIPAVEPSRLPELSLVAGDAVAGAIANITGLDPKIKFPNDILIGGRKVAGILAESSEGRVVLGIGVNANQNEAELPADAQTEPTSLRLELGRRVDRAELLAAILARLEPAYDRWLTGSARSG
jgi:BirA family transcriptional regulator, biotin operon repressor / biotin---[acetyl-CoA-carboxylase] ligase